MSTTTFLVRKDALTTSRLEHAPDSRLAPGQVRVAIDHFAFTANNITYAAFGEGMSYWQFFPAADPAWGVIPVWGFASVTQSLAPGVAEGERLYGYWPMASSAVLTPQRLSPEGFREAAPHRAELPAAYNQYQRCAADALYTRDTEALQALLRPLFITSWLIDDFLADNSFFGAGTLLLSAASSKTAFGTAYCLARHAQLAGRPRLDVVGLTSPANRAFCESLGCYSRVLAYDELDAVPADTPCVYVDFAGNAGLRRRVHERFARLAHSASIGAAHLGELGGARDLPGPRATLFFAPAQIKKRHAEWGAAVFGERLAQAWHAFRGTAGDADPPWVRVQWHRGESAVQAAYAQVLGGGGDPRLGHMLSLRPAG